MSADHFDNESTLRLVRLIVYGDLAPLDRSFSSSVIHKASFEHGQQSLINISAPSKQLSMGHLANFVQDAACEVFTTIPCFRNEFILVEKLIRIESERDIGGFRRI